MKNKALERGEGSGEEGCKTLDDLQKGNTDFTLEKEDEAAMQFCSVARLSLRERNTMSLEDKSNGLTSDKGTKLNTLEDQLMPEGPEAEDRKEDNQPTAKRFEKEDNSIDLQTQTAKKYTSSTTVDLKHDSDMPTKARHFSEESVMSKSQKGFMKEFATALPVKGEGETGQGKSMSSSVCDDPVMPQDLNTLTCKESQHLLPEVNNESEQDGNTTLGVLEVGDSKEIPNLPEEVEKKEQASLQNSSSKVGNKDETKTSARLVLPSSVKMGLDVRYGLAADDDMKDHQDGIKVVALEQGQGLSVATGDNETRRGRKESVRLGHEKLLDVEVEHGQMMEDLAGSELVEDMRLNTERGYKLQENTKLEIDNSLDKERTVNKMADCFTEETISQHQDGIAEDPLDLWTQAALSEDSKQDQKSEEKPDEVQSISEHVGYDSESFTVLSLSSSTTESGFSDQFFVDCACTGDPSNSLVPAEQDNGQELLDMNAKRSHQLHSELHISASEASVEQLSRYSKPLKAKFAEFEDHIQVSRFVMNFAPQKSRIAARNPCVRPPKDPRSLLQRPSVDPVLAPPPATKIPAGVQPLGGLGFGMKLPGLGAGFPALKKFPKKEAELKPEKGDTLTQELPQKPKWLPPLQSGFGNPFMYELKTKLKKSTQK
ncbi:uncharacterized protein si:ch211-136m16.8 isoform X2 [Dunckerocampus dactyliophorus]|nr:uncharacterized protein si:ch211-136m16.8 isoform X2 [Dunckerocampus dactyliophorus]